MAIKLREQLYYSSDGKGLWNQFAQYLEETSGLFERLKFQEARFSEFVQKNTNLSPVTVAITNQDHIEQLVDDIDVLSELSGLYTRAGLRPAAKRCVKEAVNIAHYIADRAVCDEDYFYALACDIELWASEKLKKL